MKKEKSIFIRQAPGAVFTKLCFHCNLQTSPISQSVCYRPAFLFQFYETLQLIGSIPKLRRKQSVVNTAPGIDLMKKFSSLFRNNKLQLCFYKTGKLTDKTVHIYIKISYQNQLLEFIQTRTFEGNVLTVLVSQIVGELWQIWFAMLKWSSLAEQLTLLQSYDRLLGPYLQYIILFEICTLNQSV